MEQMRQLNIVLQEYHKLLIYLTLYMTERVVFMVLKVERMCMQ